MKVEDLQFFNHLSVIDTKNEDLFYSDEHEPTRQDTAKDYLENWLLMKKNEVNIVSTKMAKDHTTGILWITLSEQDVNHIFRKAARVRNSKVKLHSFFPHQVWDRKVTLQNLCLLEKKKNPDFKFLIKPGVTDLELLTKQNGDPIWIKTHLVIYQTFNTNSLHRK